MTTTSTDLGIHPARDPPTAAVAATVAAAFIDDPVTVWLLPDERPAGRLAQPLFELYIGAYLRLGETYLTAHGEGAAVWAPPGAELIDADQEEQFGAALAELAGPDIERFGQLAETFARHHPDEPLYYCQFLATVPAFQGHGIGSAFLRDMLARADREQMPAYHEATTPRNRALYERHGYVTLGEFELPDAARPCGACGETPGSRSTGCQGAAPASKPAGRRPDRRIGRGVRLGRRRWLRGERPDDGRNRGEHGHDARPRRSRRRRSPTPASARCQLIWSPSGTRCHQGRGPTTSHRPPTAPSGTPRRAPGGWGGSTRPRVRSPRSPSASGSRPARRHRRPRRRTVDHRRWAQRDRSGRSGHRGGDDVPAAGHSPVDQPEHGGLRRRRHVVVHGPGRCLRAVATRRQRRRGLRGARAARVRTASPRHRPATSTTRRWPATTSLGSTPRPARRSLLEPPDARTGQPSRVERLVRADLVEPVERRPGRGLRPDAPGSGVSGAFQATIRRRMPCTSTTHDRVWLSDFGANALVVFDPVTEAFRSIPLPGTPSDVRQLLGRPGEVWGAESAADALVVVRTR